MNQKTNRIRRHFRYQSSFLPGDLSAGLTVGITLIPQGMAYAMLAGMPPIFGLYASTIPLLVYALIGSFPKLAVGPTAISTMLIGSGLAALATPSSEKYIQLALLLALMVGVFQLLLGLFRFGNVFHHIRPSILAGFTSGAAILIAIKQVNPMLGINKLDIQDSTFWFEYVQLIHLPTLWLGLAGVLFLFAVKRSKWKLPSQLILVILSILIASILGLSDRGVEVVGPIPEGPPQFLIPTFGLDQVKVLIPTALIISMISFIEAIAINKAIQNLKGGHEVKPNHEFIALGISNMIGSFFQSFPVSGGLSRTAINDEAGAKSRLAGLFAAGFVVVSLLFLMPYFYHLPLAALAAIIFVAILGLVDIKEVRRLWSESKIDFSLFMSVVFCTLVFGIQIGIAYGAVLSVIFFFWEVGKTRKNQTISNKLPKHLPEG